MVVLQFPEQSIVGTVDWLGAWDDARGPVLATGSVEVPDGVGVTLSVDAVTHKTLSAPGSWQVHGTPDQVDLEFARFLPSDVIDTLQIRAAVEASFPALVHLAPGLRTLTLSFSGLGNAVLGTVAQLTRLVSLQTFGNHFTDDAVQQLESLTELEHLYLEEETLTARAFDFATGLPRLTRLGLQDVPITEKELAALRDRLPGVDVG